MCVLDIDLDFFLSKRRTHRIGKERPSDQDAVPWSCEDVRVFLEERCGLSAGKPVPGSVVVQHDEVFGSWQRLIQAGTLRIPFDVVHVDAHADLGMGDGSWTHIMGELVHRPVAERQFHCASQLGEGNYLAYAVACRWVKSITYVYHPELVPRKLDIWWGLMKGYVDQPHVPGPDRVIQLKLLPRETLYGAGELREVSPLGLEPEVPLKVACPSSCRMDGPPSFVFLSQSPSYTPPASDLLIPLIRRYIDEL
jgi:hypothetical protein